MTTRIYTRTYSPSSVGSFISGKGSEGDPLSDSALLEEFENHSKSWNKVFTALVSASRRIVDSVRRAFAKHYEDGEAAEDIWIAFIVVPPSDTTTVIHSAGKLAKKCGLPKPNKLCHEFVFEWAIPEEYVVHEVSLETLLKRGLQEEHFLRPYTGEVRSTAEIRHYVWQEFQQQYDPWHIGIMSGAFAQKFGAKAPLGWIGRRFFYDSRSSSAGTVDRQFRLGLDAGIETAIDEFWLSDTDVQKECREFEEWRGEMEDGMAWDLIGFWETWLEVGDDGIVREMPGNDEVLLDRAWSQLSVNHEGLRAAIEAEAVRIGL